MNCDSEKDARTLRHINLKEFLKIKNQADCFNILQKYIPKLKKSSQQSHCRKLTRKIDAERNKVKEKFVFNQKESTQDTLIRFDDSDISYASDSDEEELKTGAQIDENLSSMNAEQNFEEDKNEETKTPEQNAQAYCLRNRSRLSLGSKKFTPSNVKSKAKILEVEMNKIIS